MLFLRYLAVKNGMAATLRFQPELTFYYQVLRAKWLDQREKANYYTRSLKCSMMSKGNSEWDKVCQVAQWELQISFCSLALLFELFKACSGEMRTISMTICTVSHKEEAFFFRQNFCITQLLQQPAICWEEKKKTHATSGLHNIKTLIVLTSSCLEWKTYPYKTPCHVTGLSLHFLLRRFWKKRKLC